jgi:hypothetical protein
MQLKAEAQMKTLVSSLKLVVVMNPLIHGCCRIAAPTSFNESRVLPDTRLAARSSF